MFTKKFLDNLKDKISLVELASEFTSLEKIGPNLYQGKCPHPQHNDKNPSLRIWTRGHQNNTYDSWACMVCHYGNKNLNDKNNKNYGSDVIAFYQWVKGIGWNKAVRELSLKYNIPMPKSHLDFLYKDKRIKTLSYVRNLTSVALNYLYGRGLSDKDIKDWMIGYQGDKIVFPLLDRYKQPVGFSKRWLNLPPGKNDKYKNSPTSAIFNKSSYFYGQHNIIESFDEIRITEGPMDVIMAHKYGARNISATLGTAFTDEHAQLIKQMGKIPVFIMDGDEPGILAAEKAIAKMADLDVYSKILVLPAGKDLCQLANEIGSEIENYIQCNSLTYGQYKIQKVVNLFESELNELKIKRYGEVKNILEKIPYEVERNIMKEYILKRMDIRL